MYAVENCAAVLHKDDMPDEPSRYVAQDVSVPKRNSMKLKTGPLWRECKEGLDGSSAAIATRPTAPPVAAVPAIRAAAGDINYDGNWPALKQLQTLWVLLQWPLPR